MRIVLIGADGQLATELSRILDHADLLALRHQDLDITDAGKVGSAVDSARPDIVINTAAFHRVDDCEVEAEKAFAVNALGARNLARACAKGGAALLHISTDYVFDGRKKRPYAEDDPAFPLSVYGASKLAGELFIRFGLERHYIVRTTGLFGFAGASGKGGNFVRTMLRLAREGSAIKVVADQRMSPTSAGDLANKLVWLMETECYGTYHITNAGECSWYEFADAIFAETGITVRLEATTTEALGARARRPAYSVLGNVALRRKGSDDLPHWRDALHRYLASKGSDGSHLPPVSARIAE